MTDRPPIPSKIWTKLVAFLRAGSDGEIVLEVQGGRVVGAKLREDVDEET